MSALFVYLDIPTTVASLTLQKRDIDTTTATTTTAALTMTATANKQPGFLRWKTIHSIVRILLGTFCILTPHLPVNLYFLAWACVSVCVFTLVSIHPSIHTFICWEKLQVLLTKAHGFRNSMKRHWFFSLKPFLWANKNNVLQNILFLKKVGTLWLRLAQH